MTFASRSHRAPAKPRSRVEKRRYNGRSAEARRVRVLFQGFIARLDDAANPATVAAARRAAELVALTEALRAKAIRGEAIDLANLVKAENLAARSVRALGLSNRDALPSLRELMNR
jgi:hypothetical protein